MSGKTLLLFGGTGATGSHVLPHAVALGIKVVMFVRDPSKINQSFKDKVESFQGSMDDLDAVRKCVKQHVPDFILLTAALPRGQPFKPLSSAVIPAIDTQSCPSWDCLTEDGRQDQVRIVHLGGFFSPAPGHSVPLGFRIAGKFAIPCMGLQGNITDATCVIDWMSKHPQAQLTSIRMWNVAETPSKGILKLARINSSSFFGKLAFTDMALFMVKIASDDALWQACRGQAVEAAY